MSFVVVRGVVIDLADMVDYAAVGDEEEACGLACRGLMMKALEQVRLEVR